MTIDYQGTNNGISNDLFTYNKFYSLINAKGVTKANQIYYYGQFQDSLETLINSFITHDPNWFQSNMNQIQAALREMKLLGDTLGLSMNKNLMNTHVKLMKGWEYCGYQGTECLAGIESDITGIVKMIFNTPKGVYSAVTDYKQTMINIRSFSLVPYLKETVTNTAYLAYERPAFFLGNLIGSLLISASISKLLRNPSTGGGGGGGPPPPPSGGGFPSKKIPKYTPPGNPPSLNLEPLKRLKDLKMAGGPPLEITGTSSLKLKMAGPPSLGVAKESFSVGIKQPGIPFFRLPSDKTDTEYRDSKKSSRSEADRQLFIFAEQAKFNQGKKRSTADEELEKFALSLDTSTI